MKGFAIVGLIVLCLFLTACAVPRQTVIATPVPTEMPRSLVKMTFEATKGNPVRIGHYAEVTVKFKNQSDIPIVLSWDMSGNGLFAAGDREFTLSAHGGRIYSFDIVAEKIDKGYLFMVVAKCANDSCDFIGGNSRSVQIDVIQ